MMLSYIMLGHDKALDMGPNTRHPSAWYSFVMEVVFGTMFVAVYLHAKVKTTNPSNNPGLIAMTLFVIQFTFASYTQKLNGGTLNPTIGFAATTFRAMVRSENDPANIKYLPAYLFGPLLGGLAAAYFTKFIAMHVMPDTDKRHYKERIFKKTVKRINHSETSNQ